MAHNTSGVAEDSTWSRSTRATSTPQRGRHRRRGRASAVPPGAPARRPRRARLTRRRRHGGAAGGRPAPWAEPDLRPSTPARWPPARGAAHRRHPQGDGRLPRHGGASRRASQASPPAVRSDGIRPAVTPAVGDEVVRGRRHVTRTVTTSPGRVRESPSGRRSAPAGYPGLARQPRGGTILAQPRRERRDLDLAALHGPVLGPGHPLLEGDEPVEALLDHGLGNLVRHRRAGVPARTEYWKVRQSRSARPRAQASRRSRPGLTGDPTMMSVVAASGSRSGPYRGSEGTCTGRSAASPSGLRHVDRGYRDTNLPARAMMSRQRRRVEERHVEASSVTTGTAACWG